MCTLCIHFATKFTPTTNMVLPTLAVAEQWYDRLLNWHLAPITRSNHCHLLFRTTSPKTYTAALERALSWPRRFAEHQYARPSTGTWHAPQQSQPPAYPKHFSRGSLFRDCIPQNSSLYYPSHNGDLRARQRISRHPSRRLAHCLYDGQASQSKSFIFNSIGPRSGHAGERWLILTRQRRGAFPSPREKG